MSKVSIPFEPSSLSSWQAQLQKELKENSSLLEFNSDIEGLQLSLTELEGEQLQTTPNEVFNWKRMVNISAQQEKIGNTRLLSALMQGADAIYIENADTTTNWSTLLSDIETEYIDCLISFKSKEALTHFYTSAEAKHQSNCTLLQTSGAEQNLFNGFSLQQIGANCATQLAGVLIDLQQHLERNAASKTLYFELGIGADFLLEIAKIKAFCALVAQLQEIHSTQFDIQLISKTGFCNKSLMDPYTNLLRQATEALSAVLGGAHFICIQPYDALNASGSSAFSQRMALNIGNLLNEEAQLAYLQTPIAGAYAVEQLALALTKKSWQLLCDLDADQQQASAMLKKEIERTRKIRAERFLTAQDTLIGINAYENPFAKPTETWGAIPEAYGFPYLIFEKLSNK
ncbi:MAG: methylmalonyl-CoA mutase family protein [Flavobacteriales bacterium]